MILRKALVITEKVNYIKIKIKNLFITWIILFISLISISKYRYTRNFIEIVIIPRTERHIPTTLFNFLISHLFANFALM